MLSLSLSRAVLNQNRFDSLRIGKRWQSVLFSELADGGFVLA
jgi:hypothetical protein